MGFRDGLRGVGKELKARARETTQALRSAAEERDSERLEQFDLAWAQTTEKLQGFRQEAQARRRRAEAVIGETKLGAKGGATTRNLSGVLGQVPILSLVPDVVNERNSTRQLEEAWRDDPLNPLLNLWLGEALKATERDARRYTAARAAMDPMYMLVREGMRSSAALGLEHSKNRAQQMLNRAYSVGMQQLSRKPDDVEALDVIARVYLAMGRYSTALKPAKLAVSQSPMALSHGFALVTLARAYLAMRFTDSAEIASRLAVQNGCTLGYETLAEIDFAVGSSARPGRLRQYGELRSQITTQDRLGYYGTYRTLSETAHAIAMAQRAKSKEGWDRASKAVSAASRESWQDVHTRLDDVANGPEWQEARSRFALMYQGETKYKQAMKRDRGAADVTESFKKHPSLMAAELSRKDLYNEAQRLGLRGRSSMNKRELARAIARARAD